jgi:hypothetical protein
MKALELLEERGPWLDTPSNMSLDERVLKMSERFETARKMLGLTNKLSDPAERQMHRRRVMGILNQIRNELASLTAALADENQDRAQRYGV